ncbi:phosphoenolpyruvate--protein phosphotransferase [Changpingibacter yushuensis]|uniref:phosphoenolpyruvate--protein phosphotransferase n=1 Tax=Changpingibacter yushuensis TaxID=2758440 RepID=UPI0015F5C656|nr:phosphoenolpyruvate--protein phosphotransferase [Changpingibacter yushuensis]
MTNEDSTVHPNTEASIIFGTPVVSGMAYAPVMWAVRPSAPALTAPAIPEDSREAEFAAYEAAAATVAERLLSRSNNTIGAVSDVLKMSAALATDKGVRRAVRSAILKEGTPAVQALVQTTETFVELFKKAGGLMAERVTDLLDVRDRVVAQIQGLPEPGVPTPEEPSVLFATDLAPADTSGLDPTLVIGIATELGGPTSHTAIICRQLGIPCIVAVRDLEQIPAGERVLLDGAEGSIQPNPDPERARIDVERDAAWRASILQWQGPAKTTDGHHVELLSNVQDGTTAKKAADGQSEGIGLFRTELSFLEAQVEPTIEEQVAIYKPVFDAFPQNKVVVRTLDAGSDKPIAYANMEHEDNPALGVRGLRITGQNPQILSHQLDAVAQASAGRVGKTWVMAPMVATLPEAEWFAKEVHDRGLTAGIMVEVPAVAILAEHFLTYVDFVSIGTNDLTQYTMAADRLSSHLAEYTDPWQPAVLKLIDITAQAGKKLNKPVGVCGEAAADPVLACVLVGMGVTSLSMASSAVSMVGAQISAVSLEQCEAAAVAVRAAKEAKEARALARHALGIL